jgi:pimeloyl-ACP methyl ester carboxylesterase
MKVALPSGLELAYDESGDGTPLLFIHGWPHNRTLWAGQMIGLAGGARCIAPDLRGFGESTVSPPWSIDQYADDLAEFLHVLGVSRAIVCGLSMGGYIAFSMFRRHRPLVEALILTSTRATADTDDGRARREKLIAFVNDHGVAPLASRQLPAMVGETTLQTRPEITEQLRELMAGAPREGVTGALRAMADRHDSTDLLGEIDVPTLVINGEEDTFTPTEEMREMASRIPPADFVTIPESGHVCAFEQPVLFNMYVRGFVEYVISGRGRYISST